MYILCKVRCLRTGHRSQRGGRRRGRRRPAPRDSPRVPGPGPSPRVAQPQSRRDRKYIPGAAGAPNCRGTLTFTAAYRLLMKAWEMVRNCIGRTPKSPFNSTVLFSSSSTRKDRESWQQSVSWMETPRREASGLQGVSLQRSNLLTPDLGPARRAASSRTEGAGLRRSRSRVTRAVRK